MKTSIIFLFLMSFLNALSQDGNSLPKSESDLEGLWQAKSNSISSNLHSNFRFYKGGRFIYNTENYDDLNPIICIYGGYRINKGNLEMRIDSFKCLVDYRIIESDPGFQFGVFQLSEGKTIIKKQNDLTFSSHSFLFKDKKYKKIALIDNQLFFKISENPN